MKMWRPLPFVYSGAWRDLAQARDPLISAIERFVGRPDRFCDEWLTMRGVARALLCAPGGRICLSSQKEETRASN